MNWSFKDKVALVTGGRLGHRSTSFLLPLIAWVVENQLSGESVEVRC